MNIKILLIDFVISFLIVLVVASIVTCLYPVKTKSRICLISIPPGLSLTDLESV